jgi:hypothetical protein
MGKGWMRIIGVRSVILARIVCLLVVLAVGGLLALIVLLAHMMV